MNRFVFSVTVFLMVSSVSVRAQKFQVGVNAADLACLGTLNGEFEYAFDRHWSAGISGKYNPFTYGDGTSAEGRQMQARQRSVELRARWWPWYIYSGWWVSGTARIQEYNMGGIFTQETEEGTRYGGGLSAGYSCMLSPHFNIDFGVGIWAGYRKYTLYECPKCGRKVDEGTGGFFLPNDIKISVAYVF